MNPVIDTRSLNFANGSVTTLSWISLQVADGESLGIDREHVRLIAHAR